VFDKFHIVLSAEEMRRADRSTIDTFGVAGFTLMETAGRCCARIAEDLVSSSPSPHVVVLVGKGNNGGDGLVISRVLHEHGWRVTAVLCARPSELRDDSQAHFDLLSGLAPGSNHLKIRLLHEFSEVIDAIPSSSVDLYVDALLGTGLESEVREPILSVIRRINEISGQVLSVDIPSGLDANTGEIHGIAMKANDTVTMAALKPGLLIGEGPDYSGDVHIAEIGIPNRILETISTSGTQIRRSDRNAVNQILPLRTRTANKYTSGPTLVVAGSSRFTGAAVLASTAAARIGSGYVTVVAPPEIETLLSEKLTEIPVVPWSMKDGMPDADATVALLGKQWNKAKSILIGPGLGRGPQVNEFVTRLMRQTISPVVVDADGLYALRENSDIVSKHAAGRWVFTPHMGEFEMLHGTEAAHDEESRSPIIERVRALSRRWNVVILLKGIPSLIAAPDGRVVINDTGNSASATAGTGDVLAGMVAGLIAQGLEAFDAAVSGIHLAGRLTDQYAEQQVAQSMMA